MSKNKNDKNKSKEFNIPKNVERLSKLTFKKFKKENKDSYDSKKDLKKGYYIEVTEYLSDAIVFLIKYGYLENVKDLKNQLYSIITDKDYVKWLIKKIDGDLEFENMELLPAIINDILKDTAKAVEANPDATFDVADLVELSSLILKKKIKKFKKEDIDEKIAFSILSVVPSESILKNSPQFRIRSLFQVLYDSAKETEIDFAKVIKILFKDDDYIPSIITFALLERKEKIATFTDTQKKLFNDITEYCFKMMEEMKKDEIRQILNAYIASRKKDEAQGKDGNRRYYISSLPEKDYEKILSVVTTLIEKDEESKKYL